jgi:hypothetical protein
MGAIMITVGIFATILAFYGYALSTKRNVNKAIGVCFCLFHMQLSFNICVIGEIAVFISKFFLKMLEKSFFVLSI